MKMFILIPPQHLAVNGADPIVACDDESYAASRPDVEHISAVIYSDADQAVIDTLQVGERCYDEQGWNWYRANDRDADE